MPRLLATTFVIALALVALACTREVQVPVERTVVVERMVQVLVTPTSVPPTPTPVPAPRVYKLGIYAEPNTRNFWNYMGGPGASVWTGFVLDGVATTLYTYSDQRFDWVPLLADGFPTPLARETVGDKTYWTSTVKLKKGATWSDGVEITADDFVFVVDTVLEFQLGSNWANSVNPDYVDHVDALDSHTLKVFFKSTDSEGNPITPGLSVWQFGLAFMPILPKHYWESVVQAARSAGDLQARQQALFAYVPENEPTANGTVLSKWEPGAFIEYRPAANWFRKGIKVVQYENGAYRELAPWNGYDVTFYGNAQGPTSLELEIGPHFDSEIFNLYSGQEAAVLALMNGDVDYIFNPNGLDRGFQERIRSAQDLRIVSNPSMNLRYLGFNVRKAPMDNKAFRQALATLIDKEFVCGTLLQGAAFPAYSMVPQGNAFWYNGQVSRTGEGLGRAERVARAVQLLKDAGFTYEVEPKVSEDGRFVEVKGKGLRMPDGTPVPELTILAPSAGYDPLRASFAIWIERWLNEIGVPARAELTSINLIGEKLFSETAAQDVDMWVLGWSLTLFPDYLESFFHSRHADGGFNWGGYANPEFDRLAEELLMETDLERARQKVMRMQEFLADDLPYVTLFTTSIQDAYRPNIVRFPYTETLGGIPFVNGLQQKVMFE